MTVTVQEARPLENRVEWGDWREAVLGLRHLATAGIPYR